MPDRRAIVRHALTLTAIAFFLHLAWESIQCPLFFEHGSYRADWLGMVAAGVGDVALTWAIYGAVAAASKTWPWARGPWTSMQILTVIATALALAVAVELRALHTGRWAYQDGTPLIPYLDVSLIPLLQLTILTPLVITLAEWLAGMVPPLAASEIARRRYDRIAPVYDLAEWMMELRFRVWRRQLWAMVDGERVLELGAGTGKNLRFYPPGTDMTAIDISENMLRRARRRARRLDVNVRLDIADAEALPFDDSSFDTVVATFLFCSVPEPVQGLREALRVLKPGGRLFLLEHVASELPILRAVMRWADPVPFHIWGAHIDRDTVTNVHRAGFQDVTSENKSLDIVKLITAKRARTRDKQGSDLAGVPTGS